MYLTNWKFINQYLVWFNVDDVFALLETSRLLFKKFWKRIKSKEVFDIIAKIDSDLAKFIQLLDEVWKLNSKDLLSIQTILKSKSKDYTKNFQVSTSWKTDVSKVETFLQKEFKKVNISKKELKSKWLELSWEWFYYKRSLDWDLNKLLD